MNLSVSYFGEEPYGTTLLNGFAKLGSSVKAASRFFQYLLLTGLLQIGEFENPFRNANNYTIEL